MVVGVHLIIDVYDIYNVKSINFVSKIQPLMNEIISKCNLNVVGELAHQFEPIGATMIYLLSESHLSIHTYPEMKMITLDLYSCNLNINCDEVIKIINDFFKNKCIIKDTILLR